MAWLSHRLVGRRCQRLRFQVRASMPRHYLDSSAACPTSSRLSAHCVREVVRVCARQVVTPYALFSEHGCARVLSPSLCRSASKRPGCSIDGDSSYRSPFSANDPPPPAISRATTPQRPTRLAFWPFLCPSPLAPVSRPASLSRSLPDLRFCALREPPRATPARLPRPTPVPTRPCRSSAPRPPA